MMTGVSIIGDFRKKQFSETTEIEPELSELGLLNELVGNITGKKTKPKKQKINVIKLNEENLIDTEEHKYNIYSHQILPKNFKHRLIKPQRLQKRIKRSKWLNI